MKKRKIKKLRISDAGKINLKKTDFFENAKFISGLPNGYFLSEKTGIFAFFALFAFLSKKLHVYQLVELNYIKRISC